MNNPAFILTSILSSDVQDLLTGVRPESAQLSIPGPECPTLELLMRSCARRDIKFLTLWISLTINFDRVDPMSLAE